MTVIFLIMNTRWLWRQRKQRGAGYGELAIIFLDPKLQSCSVEKMKLVKDEWN